MTDTRTHTQSLQPNPARRRPRVRNRLLVVILIVLLAGACFYFLWPDTARDLSRIVHVVKKRDLVISVLEGGSLESTNSLEIKSEVEGRATIISIIPDGTILTEEDVKNGRVLVELDSADLREKAAQQEITFQNASADYTQAKESYDIQKNQNESDIQGGQLNVKFALMDLEKYLGVRVAADVLAGKVKLSDLGLGELPAGEALELLDRLKIGGSALQKKKELESNIDLAQEEVARAADEYKWSKDLGPKEMGGKGYISGSKLEADRLVLKRRMLEEDQARLSLEIFLKYDFSKEAEKLLSDYVEANRELKRIEAKARAELAQAEARLKSREAAFNLQKERLEKLRKQIANCIIRAPRPGMVVYASTTDWRGRAQNPIEEGAEVRERQIIFIIPDPSSMAVKAQVHESVVNRVRVGQKVHVVVDAYPDKVFAGRIAKVGRLPEGQRWMSPDLKVYSTTVSIDNPPSDLKPGMSARITILVGEIKDVVAVPVQAVSFRAGQRVCYVANGQRVEARPVTTGQSNDNFIHIIAGLEPGDRVRLDKPDEVLVDSPPAMKPSDETRQEKGREQTPAEPKNQKAKSEPPADAGKEMADSGKRDDSGEDLDAAFQQMLQKMPAQFRERAKKRWEGATEEERRAQLKRMREGGGTRMRREGDRGGERGGESSRRPRNAE